MLSWELMSLSSFLAILYDRDSEETRSGALYYLVTMQIGAMVLLAGFAFLYLESGSFMLDSVRIGGYAKWLLLAGLPSGRILSILFLAAQGASSGITLASLRDDEAV